MLITGYVLTALLAAMIVGVGTRFLLAPGGAAAGYGVPIDTASGAGPITAFTSIKGVRDIASGLVVIVRRNHGTWAVALGIHAFTAVLMWITAALLLLAD